MTKSLLLALALTSTLTACGGEKTLGQPESTPTPSSTESGSGTSCTPSGTGTTDLSVKPVVTPPTTPAPTTTTTIDIVCGTGAEAKEGSNVEVKYVGVLYQGGKEFDSSWSRGKDETLPFTICERIIPGFCLGTTGMRVGGRREVIVTPADGYGPQGQPPVIPGNATLIFTIDLVKVS